MLTMEEREIIRHALGLSKPNARGVGYRNRYYAAGASREACRGLVAKGLAIEVRAGKHEALFQFSSAAFQAVKRKNETMDLEETKQMLQIDAVIRAVMVETTP